MATERSMNYRLDCDLREIHGKGNALKYKIMTSKKEDRSTWAIGGMTMVGVGVGLIFVRSSPILLVASIIIGIGIGVVITSLISNRQRHS